MLRWAGPLILALSAAVALVASLVIGGGAAPQALQDPGAFVRWSVPTAKLIVNVAGSVMLGSLVLALFALAPKGRAFAVSLDTASISAALFTVASGATTFLTYMSTLNPKLSLSQEFGAQLGRFLTESEAGQAWL
ncbi:MAG: copper transporter, partial [Microbacterium gubbeenense]